jgi:predicted DNA-binding transcriptional regulator AlpA
MAHLWNIDEVAEHLNMSRATILTWRSRDPDYFPPAIKIGGRLRWRMEDIERWIEDHREAAPNQSDPDPTAAEVA